MSIEDLTEEELYKIYSILASQIKRNIIKFIGTKGKAGATEIRKELKISVGALYYNLDDLIGFVTQDQDKKYKLTEKGKVVFNLLVNERERISDLIGSSPHPYIDKIKSIVYALFTPLALFVRICRDLKLVLPLSIVVMLVGLLGMRIGNFELVLISPIDNSKWILLASLTKDVRILLSMLISWISIFLICEVGALIAGSKIISSEFANASMISLSPIFAYPYINIILSRLQGTLLGYIVLGMILRLLQILSLLLLTAFITSYKKLRVTKSFIISTVIFYIAIVIESLIVFR